MFSAFEPDPDARREPLPIEVRGALAGDVDAVAEIRRERRGGDIERHRRWARVTLKRARRAPADHCFLVACHEGRVLGYATAGKFSPPPEAPANVAPEGYYLRGVVVSEAARRRGLGRRLTAERLAWIRTYDDRAFYCVSRKNLASIRLHESFGFTELTQDFWFPKLDFSKHGGGALYRVRGLRGGA